MGNNRRVYVEILVYAPQGSAATNLWYRELLNEDVLIVPENHRDEIISKAFSSTKSTTNVSHWKECLRTSEAFNGSFRSELWLFLPWIVRRPGRVDWRKYLVIDSRPYPLGDPTVECTLDGEELDTYLARYPVIQRVTGCTLRKETKEAAVYDWLPYTLPGCDRDNRLLKMAAAYIF